MTTVQLGNVGDDNPISDASAPTHLPERVTPFQLLLEYMKRNGLCCQNQQVRCIQAVQS